MRDCQLGIVSYGKQVRLGSGGRSLTRLYRSQKNMPKRLQECRQYIIRNYEKDISVYKSKGPERFPQACAQALDQTQRLHYNLKSGLVTASYGKQGIFCTYSGTSKSCARLLVTMYVTIISCGCINMCSLLNSRLDVIPFFLASFQSSYFLIENPDELPTSVLYVSLC